VVTETDSIEWFPVPDSANLRDRVTLVNHAETYLLVIAKRLEAKPIFATSVQQGYYSDVWGGGKPVTPLFSNPSQFARTGSLSPLKARGPSALKFPYRALRPWAITSVNELRDSAP
jgi:hypothetical protein